MRRFRASRWLPGTVGTLFVLVVWTVIASTWLTLDDGVPTPWAVVKKLVDDGWSFYWPLIQGTGGRAIPGFLVGNGIALVLAFVVVLVPQLEKLVLQVAVTSYCLPVLAIGPILTITLSGDHPMEALAALFVIFTTLVGALLGLRSADPVTLDLVRAYGGGSVAQLQKVRLRAALPSTLAALRVAAPTSVLGAILGEYLGGNSNVGLGYTMIASEQALEIARTWGCALVAAAMGGVGYFVVGVLIKLLTPWAASTTAVAPA